MGLEPRSPKGIVQRSDTSIEGVREFKRVSRCATAVSVV
jgi:hypothetical protein